MLAFLPIAAGFFFVLIGLFAGEPGDGLRQIEREIGLARIEEIAPRFAAAGEAR